eukprot:TRINITY_DN7635_c0_g2_i1.p1 TRINITY_DN7635_c0_g2~~TRINITY_DN7635_c0_g2_i1.p1  ORF type:complete len:298 (+),score=47.68 TRINITY_DN7635_c0_g2_i1:107-1000(+)
MCIRDRYMGRPNEKVDSADVLSVQIDTSKNVSKSGADSFADTFYAKRLLSPNTTTFGRSGDSTPFEGNIGQRRPRLSHTRPFPILLEILPLGLPLKTENIVKEIVEEENKRRLSDVKLPMPFDKVVLPDSGKARTLVLDLEQTIVTRTGRANKWGFKIFYADPGHQMKSVCFGVRPFLFSLLHKVSELFDIVVFSEESQNLVQAVVDRLDKDRRFFCAILDRRHCLEHEGALIKDLRAISNRKLSDVIAVDDEPQRYTLQSGNVYKIQKWTGDREDCELLKLAEHLIRVSKGNVNRF